MKLASIASLGLIPTIIAEVINGIPDVHQFSSRHELRPNDTANDSRVLAARAPRLNDVNLNIPVDRFWYGVDVEVGNPPQKKDVSSNRFCFYYYMDSFLRGWGDYMVQTL